MAQKYIVNDIVMYDNKVMAIKEPRDGSHFDLSCPKEGLVYCLVDIDKIKPVMITPEIVEKNNLEILKIDLINDDESFARLYDGERSESCKVYTTLESLDFEVDSIFMQEEVGGTVYCQDKDTKEPVWIVSSGDEGMSWWEVNRVPDFYKNKEDKP